MSKKFCDDESELEAALCRGSAADPDESVALAVFEQRASELLLFEEGAAGSAASSFAAALAASCCFTSAMVASSSMASRWPAMSATRFFFPITLTS